MSYSRLLAIWSQNVTLNACISSSAAAELLEDWSRVALVALEARIQPVWAIFVLEVAASVLAVDALLALVRVAVVWIQESALTVLIWRSPQSAHADIATFILGVLAIILPNLGAFWAESNRLLETLTDFFSKSVRS